jgi:IS4 transposase
LLDLKTAIPEFIFISEASVHDVNALDYISIEKGSYYVMDKAYIDFRRLYNIKLEKAFFVVREKNNIQFDLITSRLSDQSLGIISDQDISLSVFRTHKRYPDHLRRIEFYDTEFKRSFVFLTNNFKLKASTITNLYKCRWKIELFFKWIKQNLKVQSFWGFTENAVKTQIWVAISVYVLVAIIKKKLKILHSPYEILQYISLAPFEKIAIADVFLNNENQDFKELEHIQLKMF